MCLSILRLTLLGVLILRCAVVQALSEYDVLLVAKQFSDHFLSPANQDVVRTINSTLFSENVTGTVDLSTNFDGRELSTEYLFGLFVNSAKNTSAPTPFGTPIAYNVTAAVVQHNTISVSVKYTFYLASIDRSFPVQLDSFLYINDARQIQQYDVSFRRWAWATDTFIPLLIPKMAIDLGINSTNATEVLQKWAAREVCTAALANCNATNLQYETYDECIQFVTSLQVGEWYRLGENNLLCRLLHTPMLPLRPQVHCPHVGPTGGDMCVARDYTQVVVDSHFPLGWLAPKFVTPENQAAVGGIAVTNGTDLDPLLEISMSSRGLHSWDPSVYATCLLGYLLLFYLVANIIWLLYSCKSDAFRRLGIEHRKNVVMYTMNIIFTTIALGLELAATPAIAGKYHNWEVQALRTGGVLVSGLYCFELIYRLKMRLPLVVHHFLTIFAISFTVTLFEYTQSMTYMVSAIIWLFQATTEQASFVGLLGYRLEWSPKLVAAVLRFAALQTFVLKSASAIALLVYWGLHENYTFRPIDVAWTVMVFVIAIGLMMTQLWGSYVTYAISRRVTTRPRLPPATAEVAALSTSSTSLSMYHALGQNAALGPGSSASTGSALKSKSEQEGISDAAVLTPLSVQSVPADKSTQHSGSG